MPDKDYFKLRDKSKELKKNIDLLESLGKIFRINKMAIKELKKYNENYSNNNKIQKKCYEIGGNFCRNQGLLSWRIQEVKNEIEKNLKELKNDR